MRLRILAYAMVALAGILTTESLALQGGDGEREIYKICIL